MNHARSEGTILVWDFPTRAFHWMLAISFLVAYVTSESETWFGIHLMSGVTLVGLIVFRLFWGLVGTRHARFGALRVAPAAVLRYLKSLLGSAPEHHVGHNPAGSVAILLLLGLGLGAGLTGLSLYYELGGEWLKDIHEFCANALLAVVLIHIAGVVVSSFLHRENLARAMVNGYKKGGPGDAAGRAHRGVAMLLVAAVIAWWASYALGVVTVDVPAIMQEKHDGHEGYDHD
ncbi:MAG: cytochrome b/b6 domain-containing protein [Rhodocyclaceae bacterium]|nr:cytochrome b/b6 domain-containing protein [Rhodocyclaceae bacterium]MCP5239749.1 cytochrome b/b6 domain-containing protein [Zoogloeaceae bacterium]MCP5254014.1 cytochrome b/b6 domain-containing protein [Zoogloeaceae bacterium]MCP5293594.1 cytochrome b/b6 domain-containing protein [Zoogloeaceae bacterium]MCW5616718.1 cytochrome b/b6 domain-containing protein [Rhodocyclaceae bacterium]